MPLSEQALGCPRKLPPLQLFYMHGDHLRGNGSPLLYYLVGPPKAVHQYHHFQLAEHPASARLLEMWCAALVCPLRTHSIDRCCYRPACSYIEYKVGILQLKIEREAHQRMEADAHMPLLAERAGDQKKLLKALQQSAIVIDRLAEQLMG